MSEADRPSGKNSRRRRGGGPRNSKRRFRGPPKDCDIYLVGGAVRDQLLNRQITERDWVVIGSTPKAMVDCGFIPVAKDFPVFIHPDNGEEYALARTERKTGPGYHGFSFHASKDVTLEEDLIRRDLTVNAMAMDKQGNLIDPFDGRRDLEKRILRHVSPAFSEDPLRVLRVARFAARYRASGFSIAPETMELMRQISDSGELSALTPERVWKELSRALDEPIPSVFFRVLRECDALSRALPEIDALFGVAENPKYHPEGDAGEHLMLAIDAAADMGLHRIVRFAVLCHDLGKAMTPRSQSIDHAGHERRGIETLEKFCDRLRVPKGMRQQALHACRWHLCCHRALELRPSTIHALLIRLDAWRRPQQLDCFLLACLADARGRKGHRDDGYPQASYLRRAAEVCGRQTLAALRAEPDIDKRLGPNPDGALIARQLRHHRIQVIAKLRASFIAIQTAGNDVEP